jgi:hypothetical protein
MAGDAGFPSPQRQCVTWFLLKRHCGNIALQYESEIVINFVRLFAKLNLISGAWGESTAPRAEHGFFSHISAPAQP